MEIKLKIILFILSIFFVSCQGQELVNGDCVQRPDETKVWKLSNIKNGQATGVLSGQNVPEMAMDIKLDSSWIKTKCRD